MSFDKAGLPINDSYVKILTCTHCGEEMELTVRRRTKADGRRRKMPFQILDELEVGACVMTNHNDVQWNSAIARLEATGKKFDNRYEGNDRFVTRTA